MAFRSHSFSAHSPLSSTSCSLPHRPLGSEGVPWGLRPCFLVAPHFLRPTLGPNACPVRLPSSSASPGPNSCSAGLGEVKGAQISVSVAETSASPSQLCRDDLSILPAKTAAPHPDTGCLTQSLDPSPCHWIHSLGRWIPHLIPGSLTQSMGLPSGHWIPHPVTRSLTWSLDLPPGHWIPHLVTGCLLDPIFHHGCITPWT